MGRENCAKCKEQPGRGEGEGVEGGGGEWVGEAGEEEREEGEGEEEREEGEGEEEREEGEGEEGEEEEVGNSQMWRVSVDRKQKRFLSCSPRITL